MISNNGQFVKLTTSRLVNNVAVPVGTECEVVNIQEPCEYNGFIPIYDVKVLGTDDVIQCLTFSEVREMTLPEIGRSVFFTF